MNNRRLRQLLSVYELAHGFLPHQGGPDRMWGYIPSRRRQLKKAYLRRRRQGLPARRAMTDAAVEGPR